MHSVQRLYTIFKPSNYTLHLVIDRTARNFSGTATIHGEALQNTIVLHAKDLVLSDVTVDGQAATWQHGQDDEVTLSCAAITPGEHTVTISYSGKINDQLHGLYPCTYEVNGEKKELLATQFESHYARQVFPCVDEPEAKATFDLTLTTETGVTVLSNMPAKKSPAPRGTKQEKLQTTAFETTPRMSTYLLAFVIGDLQKTSGRTKNGVDVNIYATPAQSPASLQFALEHSIKTIQFFEDYFGTPYPLPKSDQVALPDFSNGAMENWGLVTYRESALLYDPTITSVASKQYIATVISHELSHQWFGNLVTMKWWDDLWLNESFATIMEYVCVDALYPQWNAWLEFNTNESVYALRRDSLDGVQSVKVLVHHPDEIQSVFDGAIVYAKGARLMQMMRNFVGEDAFRAGLKNYFAAHQYGNTTGDDLWAALSQASGKDVGAFMNTWLTQSGFPVLRAKVSGGNVALTQKQFFIGPHQPNDKLWPVPLDATQATLPAIFTAKTDDFAVDTKKALRLNRHDAAHYITHYSNELYEKLLAEIQSGNCDVLTRAQIIKEQSLLAKSEDVGSETLIDLLDAYAHEQNEKVWGMVSGVIADLKRFVDPDTPAERALKALAVRTAAPLYATLGWEPAPHEPEDDTMLRATIIGTMLYGEDPGAIAEARARYARQSPEQMDPELRDLILLAEVRFGNGDAAIDTLLKLYSGTQSVDLKQSICDAVTGTHDPAQLQKLIALLKDTATIRTQDTVLWFVRLLTNRYARDAAWQWLRTEWPWVQVTFGGDKSYDAFPRYAAQVLATRQQLNEYREFFEPMLSDTALKRAIQVGLNDIEARVQLIESDKQAVIDRLVQQ